MKDHSSRLSAALVVEKMVQGFAHTVALGLVALLGLLSAPAWSGAAGAEMPGLVQKNYPSRPKNCWCSGKQPKRQACGRWWMCQPNHGER